MSPAVARSRWPPGCELPGDVEHEGAEIVLREPLVLTAGRRVWHIYSGHPAPHPVTRCGEVEHLVPDISGSLADERGQVAHDMRRDVRIRHVVDERHVQGGERSQRGQAELVTESSGVG